MRTVARAVSFAEAIILTLIVPGLSEEAGVGSWSTGARLPQAMCEIGGVPASTSWLCDRRADERRHPLWKSPNLGS